MPIKPRAPEYPRPVSPVCADEISTCNDTIVYYDHDDGIEEDEKLRKAKRRRIEEHATNYLRGQPLFILTAGLKGPFEDGWRNPWTKGRKAHGLTHTASNLPKAPILRPASPVDWRSPVIREERGKQGLAEGSKDLATTRNDHLGMNDGLALSGTAHRKTVEGSVSGHEFPPKDQKVEYWLKTNEAYESSEDAYPNSSPQSPSDGKRRTRTPSRPNANVFTVKDVVAIVAHDNDVPHSYASPSRRPGQPTKSFSSPIKSRNLQIHNGVEDFHSSPMKRRSPRAPTKQAVANAQQSCAGEGRAEYAIFMSRQKTAQLATADVDKTSPSSHHGTNLRPGDTSGDHEVNSKSASPKALPCVDVATNAEPRSTADHATTLLHLAQDALSAADLQQAAVSMVHELTKSSATSELPSAQIPQIPILASLPSNFSGYDQMLAESLHDSSAAVLGNGSNGESYPYQRPGSRAGKNGYSLSKPAPATKAEVTVEEVNHQFRPERRADNGRSTRVLGAAAAIVKTAKRSDGMPKALSPPIMRKPSTLKSRKRKALSSDEVSSPSIKSALRVARAVVPTREQEEASRSRTAVKYGGDDQPILENNLSGSLPNVDRDQSTTRASVQPRSILKLVPQHSVALSVSNVGGSSSTTKQDAQRPHELDPVVGDEDGFDLDAAISDLGSYLDTWDHEKHAAGVS